MTTLAASRPSTKFGGRLLHTVNQKKDGRMFSTQITSIGAEAARTVVLAYTKKQDAVMLAQCLENTKEIQGWTVYPVMGYEFMELFDLSKHVIQPPFTSPATGNAVGPVNDVLLADLYVQTWDAYHLRDYILDNNLALLVCEANESPSFSCMGSIIMPLDDSQVYVDNLTRILDIQTMGNNMPNSEDIYDE